MANVIRHKRGTSDPVAGDFSQTAELLINTTDGGLFTKTDGGSVVEIGSGGGGLTKFTEAESTASPNDTVYVDSLTAAASSTDADVAFIAKGAGATLAQIPDSAGTGGNKRGQYATDLQKARVNADEVASGNYSTIAGGEGNRATGAESTVGGGTGNEIAGSQGTIAGGEDNTVGSGSGSTVGGGRLNTASNNWTVVSGGYQNSATVAYAAVIGGAANDATASVSCVLGGSYGTTRSIQGKVAIPASNRPVSTTKGSSQAGILVLGGITTDATAKVLISTYSGSPGTTNQLILPNNGAHVFAGTVLAAVTGGGDSAAWEFKGLIKRGANAAATSVVGTVVKNVIAYDSGAAAWDVTFSADTTNGGLKVEVTGAASTTIRWVAKLETTETLF